MKFPEGRKAIRSKKPIPLVKGQKSLSASMVPKSDEQVADTTPQGATVESSIKKQRLGDRAGPTEVNLGQPAVATSAAVDVEEPQAPTPQLEVLSVSSGSSPSTGDFVFQATEPGPDHDPKDFNLTMTSIEKELRDAELARQEEDKRDGSERVMKTLTKQRDLKLKEQL